MRSLIKQWEHGKDLYRVAARTAVALSEVHDVPLDILEAIDNVMGASWEEQGRSIRAIVGYLKSLEQLDRLHA